MAEKKSEAGETINYAGQGRAFFQRAESVADTMNWDFAIELYTQGLRREPDNLEKGHEKLRVVSLKRKAKGGKKAGLKDQWSHRIGKDPLENMANASFMFAKDPGSIPHAMQILKAAQALNLTSVIEWILGVIIELLGGVTKAERDVCVQAMYAADKIKRFDMAMKICEEALLSHKNDVALEEKMRHLTSEYTIQKGGYGKKGHDFIEGVKDLDKQKDLMNQDAAFKDDDYLRKQVEEAIQAYEAAPTEYGKINAVADALVDMNNISDEEQAIAILNKAVKDTGAYQFKMKIGTIRIKQFRKKLRILKEKGDKAEFASLQKQRMAFELEEFRERAANYPTDLTIKYEYACRLFNAGDMDQAITLFQQVQRNPRLAMDAMNLLGQAFMKKEWWDEAIDTYEKTLSDELPERKAKDLRYHLSECYTQKGRYGEARKQLSMVAQIDLNYKDVRGRLEKVRALIKENE